jgi:serine/threonine-protein kinase
LSGSRSLASVDPPPACPSCGAPVAGTDNLCPQCGGDLRGVGADTDTFVGTSAPPTRGSKDRGSTLGSLALGSIIDGRYRLREKLGEGGMGAVFKVEHVRMGKIMALKLMRPEAAVDRTALKRFQHEARIVSKLSHANTVCVFDFGELDDGALYMAMEYVPGKDLSWILRAEGNLSERRAVPVVVQVLRSLAEAHDAGIVHRDIKPANVMLLRTREGEDFAKVVDFGIAKLAEAAHGQTDKKAITGNAGEFVGTPNYMSPEQVRGEEFDARSDLYSLGAMIFELLTGRCPFVADNPLAVAAKHLTDAPPTLKAVAPQIDFSETIEKVIAKALQKAPKDRYQSADDMRAALLGGADSRRGNTGKIAASSLEVHTTGGLEIARRDDWDRFERSLRNQQRLKPVAGFLVVCAIFSGGYYGYETQIEPRLHPVVVERVPVTREVEPNDGPNRANLIAPGTNVEGLLKRIARDQADRDLFEFTVEGPGPKLAHISVTGVPNVNVAIDLFKLEEGGGEGESLDHKSLPNLAQVDDQFVGGPETMSDVKLESGRYFVRISDRKRADEATGAPRENTLDPYTLRVDVEEVKPFYEQEPNNNFEQAMRFQASRPVMGHAGARGDVSKVQTANGENAVAGTLWSDDYYELVLPAGATQGCAFLSGVRGATLTLAVVSTEHARIRKIADKGERDKATADHLARVLGRDRPARVTADAVEAKCARAQESVIFRVQVAEGGSNDRYLLAAVDDSEDGFAGVISACDRLKAEGDEALCKKVLTKAVNTLRVSKSVETAKAYLAKLP